MVSWHSMDSLEGMIALRKYCEQIALFHHRRDRKIESTRSSSV